MILTRQEALPLPEGVKFFFILFVLSKGYIILYDKQQNILFVLVLYLNLFRYTADYYLEAYDIEEGQVIVIDTPGNRKYSKNLIRGLGLVRITRIPLS